MVTYKCNKCDKEFDHKGNYSAHINKKYSCERQNYEYGHATTDASSSESDKNTCMYCHKKLSTNSNFNRHLKICKIRKLQEEEKEKIFNELVEKINKLEDDNKKLNRKVQTLSSRTAMTGNITNNIETINNNVNNTFNILAFGKEDTSHISNKEWQKIINRQYRSIEDLVVKTHFDKKKPENHNIYISNMKSKYIMVHDGTNWCVKDKRDTIDDLYDEKAYIILNKVDELKEKSKLPFKIVDKYNEIKTGYDEEKIRAALIKDIELILYNKRDIPIYTKRQIETE